MLDQTNYNLTIGQIIVTYHEQKYDDFEGQSANRCVLAKAFPLYQGLTPHDAVTRAISIYRNLQMLCTLLLGEVSRQIPIKCSKDTQNLIKCSEEIYKWFHTTCLVDLCSIMPTNEQGVSTCVYANTDNYPVPNICITVQINFMPALMIDKVPTLSVILDKSYLEDNVPVSIYVGCSAGETEIVDKIGDVPISKEASATLTWIHDNEKPITVAEAAKLLKCPYEAAEAVLRAMVRDKLIDIENTDLDK